MTFSRLDTRQTRSRIFKHVSSWDWTKEQTKQLRAWVGGSPLLVLHQPHGWAMASLSGGLAQEFFLISPSEVR